MGRSIEVDVIILFLVLGLVISGFSLGLLNYLEFNADTVDLGDRNIITSGTITSRKEVAAGTETTRMRNDFISIKSSSSSGGFIHFYEGNSGNNYVRLGASSSMSGNVTFTLPAASGTSGQFLKTDGDGNLSFATVSGVGGSVSSITAGNGLTGNSTTGDVTLSIGTCVVTLGDTQTLTNKSFNLANNTLRGSISEFNNALTGGVSFVTITGTETLTNKTLTGPSINSGGASGGFIDFLESSGNKYVRLGASSSLTQDVTLILPNSTGNSGEFLQTDGSGNLTFATVTGAGGSVSSIIAGNGLSGTSTIGDVTLSIGTCVVTLGDTQTLTNKSFNLANNTLTGSISEFNNALSGDSFVTITGTETLTNKTLTGPSINSGGASGGFIDFLESSGNKYVRLGASSSLTQDVTLILPNSTGNSGEFLQTDGSGNLTFAEASSETGVSQLGTVSENQVTIWSGTSTIKGDSSLTFSGGTSPTLTIGDGGSENPKIVLDGTSGYHIGEISDGPTSVLSIGLGSSAGASPAIQITELNGTPVTFIPTGSFLSIGGNILAGDGTNFALTTGGGDFLVSSGNIKLSGTDTGVCFDGVGRINRNGADLDIVATSTGDLNLNNQLGGNINFQSLGVSQLILDIDEGTSQVNMKLGTSGYDFVFKQASGTEVFRVEDNGDFLIGGGSGNSGVSITSTGALTADGLVTCNSGISVSSGGTSGGFIDFLESSSNGLNHVRLQAPDSLTSNVILTLPGLSGSNGQFLQTDGSGKLTFADAPSETGVSQLGTVSENQITIWSGTSTIKGDPNLTFSSGTLSVGTGVSVGGLTVGTSTITSTAGLSITATDNLNLISNGVINIGDSVSTTAKVAGKLDVGAGISVSSGGTSGGFIDFLESSSNGLNHVRLQAPDSLTSNVILTLPGLSGSNGQFLQTVTFADAPSETGVSQLGTVSENQITIWSGTSTIKGDPNLTFSSGTLSVGTGVSVGGLTVGTSTITSTAGLSITATDNLNLISNGVINIGDSVSTTAKVAGKLDVGAGISVSSGGTSGGFIDFLESSSNGLNHVRLQALDSLTSNVILTLPDASGSNGQFLQTDGSGKLTFADAPSSETGVSQSGTVSENQVTIWSGTSTIKGDPNLTFSSGTLSVGTGVSVGGLTVGTSTITVTSGLSILDTTGVELVNFISTSSAVNELTIANAANNNPPILSATGDNSSIDIHIKPKRRSGSYSR